jgi:hypothetical protein
MSMLTRTEGLCARKQAYPYELNLNFLMDDSGFVTPDKCVLPPDVIKSRAPPRKPYAIIASMPSVYKLGLPEKPNHALY